MPDMVIEPGDKTDGPIRTEVGRTGIMYSIHVSYLPRASLEGMAKSPGAPSW